MVKVSCVLTHIVYICYKIFEHWTHEKAFNVSWKGNFNNWQIEVWMWRQVLHDHLSQMKWTPHITLVACTWMWNLHSFLGLLPMKIWMFQHSFMLVSQLTNWIPQAIFHSTKDHTHVHWFISSCQKNVANVQCNNS
jgi:hypothetical protein